MDKFLGKLVRDRTRIISRQGKGRRLRVHRVMWHRHLVRNVQKDRQECRGAGPLVRDADAGRRFEELGMGI